MPIKKVSLLGYLCALSAILALATPQNTLLAQGHRTPSSQYEVTELISDVPDTALHTDQNLVNPWGIARGASGPWWINTAGTALSLVKNGAGDAFPAASPLIVTIPGANGPAEPTGIVVNSLGGFEVSTGNPAVFVFASIDGTISAWHPSSGTQAVVKVTTPDAAYFGVTIATSGGTNYLYAANFGQRRIDVFDSTYAAVDLGSDAFQDDEIPADFSPFNIQNINGTLYVMFAKKEEDAPEEVTGKRRGYVDAFTPSGDLVTRFQRGTWMNAPWGVALAPANFGRFSNALLVGMFGSGQIVAFNPNTGKFRGILRGCQGKLTIDGLWGIGFGNDANAGSSASLYFAAGIEDEAHGLFGAITPLSPFEDDDGERNEN